MTDQASAALTITIFRKHLSKNYFREWNQGKELKANQRLTCTLASAKLIFFATSSRINTSGYIVLLNKSSNTSSCAFVNVVLSRRRFGGAMGNGSYYDRETKI